MNGLLGKKLGMTQVFDQEGQVIPVTVIESGPCSVLQVKTEKSDGYNAIQVGFEDTKEAKVKKSMLGKFKKNKITPKKLIKEFRIDDPESYSIGQNIDVTLFNPGDYVKVIGTSKGKGFQGGTKRHHWKLGPKTHGSMSHREPGSIGASAYPNRVVKGHPLPGHMGCERISAYNLEVVDIDKDNNLLIVKGSVPGHNNSYVAIELSGRKKSKVTKEKKEVKKDSKGKPAKGAK